MSSPFTEEEHKAHDAACFGDPFFSQRCDQYLPLLEVSAEQLARAQPEMDTLLDDIIRFSCNKIKYPGSLSLPTIRSLLVGCIKASSFRTLRNHPDFCPSAIRFPDEDEIDPASTQATVEAWKAPFTGDSAALLINIITSYITRSSDPYSRSSAVVQSTGTGKSRMCDEMAKTVLCVPVSLANRAMNCYPPGDHEAAEWLLGGVGLAEVQLRMNSFVYALLRTTTTELIEIEREAFRSGGSIRASGNRLPFLASKFRQKLAIGGDFSSHGPFRLCFYQKVVQSAHEFANKNRDGFTLPITPPSKHPPVMENIMATLVSEGDEIEDEGEMEGAGEMEGVDKMDETEDPDEMEGAKEKPEPPVLTVATELIDLLIRLNPQGVFNSDPLLVITFDEANPLTEAVKGESWTRFSELRRVLRQIRNLPIFTLFLSTGGNFHQFSPPRENDPSNRLQRDKFELFPPITEVPFDQFSQILPSSIPMDRVASTFQMAHLGRALFPTRYDAGDPGTRQTIIAFAQTKLLSEHRPLSISAAQNLACLSVRLGLEFKAAPWMEREAERIQVERHMRVCLTATAGFSKMLTIAPSEPLLAEAAWKTMQEHSVNFPRALGDHMDSTNLSAGDRGEYAAALILLLARDRAAKTFTPISMDEDATLDSILKHDGHKRLVSVPEFLRALFSTDSSEDVAMKDRDAAEEVSSDEEGNEDNADDGMAAGDKFDPFQLLPFHDPENTKTPLTDAFRNSWMWFNHFLKVYDYGALTQEHLRSLVARGAAVICANDQQGIDILLPVVMGTILKSTAITSIFVQVNNSASFQANIIPSLFDSMDPVNVVRLFHKTTSLPLIRLVFSLASKKSIVVGRNPSARSTSRSKGQKHHYSSYDIWCAGVSSATFGGIRKEENAAYSQLVYRSQPSMIYGLSSEGSNGLREARVSARRQMNPAAGIHDDHTKNFVEVEKKEGKEKKKKKKGKTD
ncbi:hypothetical protein FB451DRAFT_1982 [Mycena latifolia]|nr:hypothetical protein FB451DRAFT_1982 [Mycena latifolia]